ncbi:hypothetical protein L7F22_058311 [Adiantum nelumboides]|nr:hypothetical protein [Adiantum nelumboides]
MTLVWICIHSQEPVVVGTQLLKLGEGDGFLASKECEEEKQKKPLLPSRGLPTRDQRGSFPPSHKFLRMNRKPGDWDCPSCDHLNFSWRDSCQRCSEPKPVEGRGGKEDERRGYGRGGGSAYLGIESDYGSGRGGSELLYGRGQGAGGDYRSAYTGDYRAGYAGDPRGGYGGDLRGGYGGDLRSSYGSDPRGGYGGDYRGGYGDMDYRGGYGGDYRSGYGGDYRGSDYRGGDYRNGYGADYRGSYGGGDYMSRGYAGDDYGGRSFGASDYNSRSYGGGSGQGGADLRPGDWYCKDRNCAAHNFASRTSCFKCGAAKDGGKSKGDSGRGGEYESGGRGGKGGSQDAGNGGEGDRPGWRSGDWLCSRSGCNEHNFATRMQCFRCQAPRET